MVGHGGLAPGTLVRVEANRFGCLDIPSPRTTGVVGMERCGHSRAELNHIRRPATWGSCRYCELAACRARTSRHLALEATDLSVTEPVVDEGEQLAGRGDSTDVAAETFGDAPVGGPDGCATVVAGHGFDR